MSKFKPGKLLSNLARASARKVVEVHHAFWEHTALAALVLEVGGIGLYAWAIGSFLAFAILFLLGLAIAAGGGILGFLFGVPRHKTDADTDGDYAPNTNL